MSRGEIAYVIVSTMVLRVKAVDGLSECMLAGVDIILFSFSSTL